MRHGYGGLGTQVRLAIYRKYLKPGEEGWSLASSSWMEPPSERRLEVQ